MPHDDMLSELITMIPHAMPGSGTKRKDNELLACQWRLLQSHVDLIQERALTAALHEELRRVIQDEKPQPVASDF